MKNIFSDLVQPRWGCLCFLLFRSIHLQSLRDWILIIDKKYLNTIFFPIQPLNYQPRSG
jgi:hypothetical protein